ncbi:putative serine/threonine-protein kinase NAK [Hordeum vulgare]|nr:putative serine/threonine-protein kinase NAK [Hordeum vulgare]
MYVKSDMYGFDVVLLAMLCDMRVLDPSRLREKINQVNWEKSLLSYHRRLSQLMDNRVKGLYHFRGVFHATERTLKCMSSGPQELLSRKKVVEMAEQMKSRKSKLKSMQIR